MEHFPQMLYFYTLGLKSPSKGFIFLIISYFFGSFLWLYFFWESFLSDLFGLLVWPLSESEVKVKLLSRVLTLCDPMACSLPGSSVLGIFQARTLEWAAISFSTGSSQPRDQTRVSCIAGRCFYHLSHQGSL